MEKVTNEKKGNKKGLKIILVSILLVLVIGVLTFFLVFHVKEVEVIGNTRYTEDEIKSMALKEWFSNNSVLVTWLDGNQEVAGIPFINGFKIEKVNNNKISIIVSEKQIIGYIKDNDKDAFFDKDGLVVEILEPKIVGDKQLIVGEEVEEAQLIKPEEIVEELPEDTTKFNAAVTNVPLVEGLNASDIALNRKIKVEDPSVFNTIWGIARMVEKFEIQPDKVVFDEESNVTMHYGDIRVLLGDDSLLEEKIARVAAILPKLTGKSGELHLEDYKAGVDTIVFSGDVAVNQAGDENQSEGDEGAETPEDGVEPEAVEE